MGNKTIRHFGKNTLNEFVEEVKERIISKIEKIEKTIPTKVSQLENDTVFATEEYVNNNSGKVKTVNGNEPDENGNVEVDTASSWNDLKDKPFDSEVKITENVIVEIEHDFSQGNLTVKLPNFNRGGLNVLDHKRQ